MTVTEQIEKVGSSGLSAVPTVSAGIGLGILISIVPVVIMSIGLKITNSIFYKVIE